MPSLEYPITRPYPWRWTTFIAAFGAGIVLAGLGLLNFIAVGYGRQSAYRDEFESAPSVSWRHKFDAKYTQTESVTCDPSSLVIGGIYRTNHAIFALSTESLRDPDTNSLLGSVNYSGDILDSCRVNRIYMMAEFAKHEAHYRAQLACQSQKTLFANFTVESAVSLRGGVPCGIVADTLDALLNEHSPPELFSMAVLYSLGLDVLASLFFYAPPIPSVSSNVSAPASSVWAEWDPLAAGADLPLVVAGMAAPDGSFIQSNDATAFTNLTTTARRAIQNYAIAFHSTILFDVGSTSEPEGNILTNLTALQTRIQTQDLFETSQIGINGSAHGINFTTPAAPFLLANALGFQLPIRYRTENPPTRLMQRYLCHSLVLKPMPTLVVDVLVATLSIFMVVWGVAQMGLMYVAKIYYRNGNYCSCPGCDAHAHRVVMISLDNPNSNSSIDKV